MENHSPSESVTFPKGVLFIFVGVGLFIFPLIVGMVIFTSPGRTPEAAVVLDPCKADFNKDGVVNSLDMSLLAQHYGTREGGANWDPKYSLNGDKVVNSLDQVLLSRMFGQKCPGSSNLSINQTGCGATGRVTATLSWTRAGDPSGGQPIQDQEMEISLDSSFSNSVTQTVNLDASSASRTFTDFFVPDTDYWWRVHTQYFGVWTTGDNVASFHSITCTAATPACTLNISTVNPGGQVIVTSQGGLSGTIGMQGAFGTPVTALGNLPAGGTATITVPANVQAGLYVVRVGAFGVACTPNLSIVTP